MNTIPNDYHAFLARKTQAGADSGFAPVFMPSALFDFQQALVDWAVRKGRAAIFADCGLGKTAMQLAWAENVVRKTNGRVLILTPLAVGAQTIREAEKFGIEAHASRDGRSESKITVANYERLHYFDPSDFIGVVCDESSALKALDGKRRRQVTEFMRATPYRLLCTATAAPNDYVELGTSSEALGYLGQRDMLSQFFRSTTDMGASFFKAGDFWNKQGWTFKAHSQTPFWRWVCSWARAIRRPSDLGFSDANFALPPMTVTQHVVDNPERFDGELFPRIATTLREQREERRLTITQRCEKVAELVAHGESAVVWCQMNDEADLCERLIPGAVQVAGSDSDDDKEARFLAFASGEARVLVTKPKIGAFGLNWQHCAHTIFFPSHSFEQYYQAVRRFWRYGQKKPVNVDIVTTPGEAGVTANLQSKADAAAAMFAALVAEMNNASAVRRSASHSLSVEIPSWL